MGASLQQGCFWGGVALKGTIPILRTTLVGMAENSLNPKP